MSEIVESSSGGHNSTFSQTCNLLSQYLKENGSLGDLTLPGGMMGKKKSDDAGVSLSSQQLHEEEQGHRLSIFYAGQVIVVDDFPPDKALEIIMLAATATATATATGRSGNPHPQIFPNSNSNSSSSTPPQPPVVSCDLPIARKASLARFFEKRKERIKARAAYGAYDDETPSKKASKQA